MYISASVILIKVLLKKQSGRFNPVTYGGSSTIPQPPQFFSLRAATLIFSDDYSYNLTLFWKVSISSIVSSSQTFYYLIWKNSKKVTKNSKKPKQNCQKVSQNMLTSGEGLSKFAEGLSSHYLQLFFPFILCTISFYLFSLYSLYNCVLYNYDFLLCSSSEWNKN